jgi:hypothetical protein
MRRICELRADGGDNRDGAVAIGNVVLDDEGRPVLLDLVADRRIERYEINLTSAYTP